MPKPTKPKVIAKLLENNGFELIRQKGSHAIFKNKNSRRVVIPMHNKELPVGTLLSILRDADLPKDVL